MYREQTIDFKEYNADMLLSYDHNFETFRLKYPTELIARINTHLKINWRTRNQYSWIYNLQKH
jgi:hypothetical protein